MRKLAWAVLLACVPILAYAYIIKNGMTLAAARSSLFHDGWKPIVTKKLNARDSGNELIGIEKTIRREGFNELEACAVDRSQCIFNYKKGKKCIRIVTQGEDISRLMVLSWTNDCPD
ncbi:hypothetical protein [Paraburkholderia acidicola]|uniref:hypothetical protein n=1 Tax=Paraburkholderia acidicola TaxID=1912599 RepID=UPI0010558DBB|nr:hypothetical protein [Paraburkholderia acidicola]